MPALDELVMAVPTAGLFAHGYFQGVQVDAAAWLDYIFDPRNSRFLPRIEAETDPAWKQVIPYVVLVCGNELFSYQRGQRSTETRLRALRSVGLGGHIKPTDETMFAAPGRAAYDAALERELTEEVALGADVVERRLVGLINDDTTEVGRVHVGLVHIWRLAAPAVRPRESKIAASGFSPAAELRTHSEGYETWSQLVLDCWDAVNSA